MIELFSASAGAGKTHRLTGEYIKRLFIGEAQYRHILAVTFTNKATEEMKSRILNELYIIASGRESRFMQELLPLVGGSQQKFRARARVIPVLSYPFSANAASNSFSSNAFCWLWVRASNLW